MHTHAYTHKHACTHAYTQTCIHTDMHAYRHARTHAYTQRHAYTHMHTHTNMHTHAYTHKHACTHAYTQTCIHKHAYTQTCIHTCIHRETCIHTDMHTHTNMHTHTDAGPLTSSWRNTLSSVYPLSIKQYPNKIETDHMLYSYRETPMISRPVSEPNSQIADTLPYAHSYVLHQNLSVKGGARKKSESESHSVMSATELRPHGLYTSWNSPGQNAGVGSFSHLYGIFPMQGSNLGLPHCRRILYQLRHQESPRILE